MPCVGRSTRVIIERKTVCQVYVPAPSGYGFFDACGRLGRLGRFANAGAGFRQAIIGRRWAILVVDQIDDEVEDRAYFASLTRAYQVSPSRSTS